MLFVSVYLWCEASEDNLREALSASRRAVELDPQSAEAHASRGFAESLSKNYETANEEFETALQLDSRLFEAYYFYGRSCFAQGQWEKAADLFAEATGVDPDDYQAHGLRGLCFRALDRTEESRGAFRDCVQTAERHLELHPDDVRAVSLGSSSLYGLQDYARAIEWADRALAMDPQEAVTLYNVSCTYALLKEADRCIDCLEKAIRLGFGHKEWIENDPDLSSVRNHPRFQALMQSLSADRSESAH